MFTVLGRTSDFSLRCLRSTQDAPREMNSLELGFDCFVINRMQGRACDQGDLIDAVAARAGWVEVFGFDAETIHDAIDNASVRLLRQRAVGDGTPMTAWHEDITQDSAIASYIWTGGQGHAPHKVALVIGSSVDEKGLIDELIRQRP